MAAWTEEMDGTLKRMWAAGNSASQISRGLDRAGLGMRTRNAVIGRIHRLKLPQRPVKIRHLAAKPLRKPAHAPNPKWDRPEKPVTVHVADIARKTLMELNDHSIGHPEHECRFPIGEPVQGFCALPAVPGSSYCEGHLQRCGAITRSLRINSARHKFRGRIEGAIRHDVEAAKAVEEFTEVPVA